ncbi:MAG: pyridoxamine 5'-phosphate oxidase family protein [Rikenella sp.]|nr:pyridoxamine 5'-phosphate oxidase family protein [Rikenella sp.]
MRQGRKNSGPASDAERELVAEGRSFEAVDPRIVRFIGRHRVLTLATASAEGALWCCNLFYAYLPQGKVPGDDSSTGGAFVFTSPADTEHARMFADSPRVAGSVVLESKVVGRLQGLQFQGEICPADATPELLALTRGAYLKRFPFAAPMLSDLWILRLARLKYTDNTLGFGTKLIWNNK